MVIPGHARSRHRYRGTPISIKRGMRTDQTKIEKGKARDVVEDQRKSEKIVGRGIS